MTDQRRRSTTPRDTARLRATLDAAASWYRVGLLADRPAVVVGLLRDRGLADLVVDPRRVVAGRHAPAAPAGPGWWSTGAGAGSPTRRWSTPASSTPRTRTAGRAVRGGGVGSYRAPAGGAAGRRQGERPGSPFAASSTACGQSLVHDGVALASRAAATASNSARAAVRSSTISRAITSGAGRLSRSSRDSSRSQVRSRLALSRATSSS